MDIRGQSIVESQQFDLELLAELFARADRMPGKQQRNSLYGKMVATSFYKPSSRTRWSFEAAAKFLGGHTISTENAAEFSSAAKGERLEHSMRMAAAYAHVVVLRHGEDNAALRAREYLNRLSCDIPIINAGCGAGQHPTQALVDLYTIRQRLGRTHDFSIAMVGDLKYGRTVRSLSYLLGKFFGLQIYFVSPLELAIGRDIVEYLQRHHVEFGERTYLSEVIDKVDFVYMTRVQEEHFANRAVYERLKDSYVLGPELVQKMKPGARILHPLPINGEIEGEVDFMSQQAYFQQMDNGLLVRQALLEMILVG